MRPLSTLNRTTPSRRRESGALLLEVGLVLLIVGVLAVGTFELQSAMRKRQLNKSADHVLQSVDAAVRTFTVRQRRLPCPDTAGSGVEAGGNSGCAALTGGVPYVTLGLEIPQLSQGQVLRYGVSGAMFPSDGPQFLARARQASLAAANADPYVAGPDASQFFATCGQVAFRPAYALMWMPPGVASPDPLCFRESQNGEMGLLAVGRAEFLGWLQTALNK